MTGSESIDLSLKNIWESWFLYRKGKKKSRDLDTFQYSLEAELSSLHGDLNNDSYKHGRYKRFTVTDNKKREISVAPIGDRVVHRLVYDYLSYIYDKTFIYDAWSCRPEKGLWEAIKRTYEFASRYKNGFVWKADVRKFFDNVDQDILLKIISRKIKDREALGIISKIIKSFPKGMPIGNLTSQIFSNIYMNELDRYIKHELRLSAYLRYGDDFVVFSNNRDQLAEAKTKIEKFITNTLKLALHQKNKTIFKMRHGLKFLGHVISPESINLNKRNLKRIRGRVSLRNASSYYGIVSKQEDEKIKSLFHYLLLTPIIETVECNRDSSKL